MKKVLLATTAVAAFVAFSGVAQAQDPGRPDYGATEGGGGAGSAFTVTTSGNVSFFLKYATGEETATDEDKKRAVDLRATADAATGTGTAQQIEDAETAAAAAELVVNARNDGLFWLISSDLEINGKATTDDGTDISTHIDFSFSGIPTDSAQAVTVGSTNAAINVGDIVRVDELSFKIAGNWGSVELGANDGAEDIFKIYGGSVAAGTGGVDGFAHGVAGGVGFFTLGGTAGRGDSSDAIKVTYLSPVVAGFQTGVNLNYQTAGPNDLDGGNLGVGLGAKYSGSGGGVDYAFSVVWGDTAIVENIHDNAEKVDTPNLDGYGGVGIGAKVGGSGVNFATGVTFDKVGAEAASEGVDAPTPDIYWSGAIAYAIPDAKTNVSVSAALSLPYGVDPSVEVAAGETAEPTNYLGAYIVYLSADYAVLPGVSLAVDLGYGDGDLANEETKSGGFTGLFRVKASF